MAAPFFFGSISSANLIRELANVSRKLPSEVRKADAATAADVGGRARMRAMALGGVHAHSARGILNRGPFLVLDTGVVPTVVAAEFGRDNLRQFPPHRGSGLGGGYMMTPELAAEKTMDRYSDILDNALD